MGWAKDEVGTIAELAKQLGSRRKAERLLKRLAVPVVEGAFSRRLFTSRLESPGAGSPPPFVQTLRAQLRPRGLDVTEWKSGRPSTVALCAVGAPVELGFPEETGDTVFRAIEITSEPVTWARLYTAKTRTGGNAYFSPGGFQDPKSPPVYLFVLLSEQRVWTINRRELAHFETTMIAGGTKPPYIGKHSREGALRLAFPKALVDWDLSMRVRASAE